MLMSGLLEPPRGLADDLGIRLAVAGGGASAAAGSGSASGRGMGELSEMDLVGANVAAMGIIMSLVFMVCARVGAGEA